MANHGSEIRSVEARIYGGDLTETFGYSKGWITRRESAVARVVTTDGTVGWGEAYANAQAAAAAIDAIGHHFIGRSVFERVAVTRATAERARVLPARAPAAAALSAVALATFDAAAKLVGLPAHALLGGACNPNLRVYASGLWFAPEGDPTAHYPETARRLVDQGFTALKAKIGLAPETDLRVIDRLLDTTADAALMVDANQAYDMAEADVVRRGIDGSQLVWWEEPLPPTSLADYAALRSRSRVPLAGGETITSPRDAFAWLTAGACDVLQPDLCLAGGLDDGAVIGTTASTAGAIVAPHCFGLGIGLAASLHWASILAREAAGDEPVWIEVDPAPNPARDALLSGCEWFRDAGISVSLPQEPGLGVDLDRIERFRLR